MCHRVDNEAHIYNVVDEGHTYEVVSKDGGLKKNQRVFGPKKPKEEFDLKPCPAYVSVTKQDPTQGDNHYEAI